MPSNSRPQSRARSAIATGGQAPFFPDPYPGETIYSIVARYQRIRGLDHVALCIDLFGMEKRVFSPTLPTSINRIAMRGAGLGLQPEDLLRENTAHGYYTAYATTDAADRLTAEMLPDEGKPVMFAGQRGAPVGLLARLRFCPACLEYMRSEHEETHWRLIHQIPIVLVCPQHGEILRESVISGTGVVPGFQVPNSKNCPDDASPVVAEHVNRDMLARLAMAATETMSKPRRSPVEWRELLRCVLAERDLLTPAGRLRFTDIQDEINRSLGPIAQAFPRIRLKISSRQTWFDTQMTSSTSSSTDRALLIELAFGLI
ncbi:TniQ family protein [Sphingomonas sp. LB2R24]|uniref:TniQ family protein n=1 Tax=Sphingomonas sorbitolis TaxID=3096165 RepID=UPI002FC8C82D